MKKRLMGRTGIRVSELCLGTLNFGWSTNREQSHAILDHYYAAGGNFIQSSGLSLEPSLAPLWTSHSESYVGDWLTDRKIAREQVFISAAISLSNVGGDATPFSRRLASACEASLERLRSDYIDLLVCRWHPSFASVEEALHELTKLVQKGRIRYFGFAGLPLWRAVESVNLALRKTLCRLEAFQAPFSLLENGAQEQQFAFCEQYRVAFLAQSPLAGGFLAARHSFDTPPLDERARRLRSLYSNSQSLAVFSEVESIADARGVTPASVALAWTLHESTVTAAIVGAKNVWHVRDALRASEITLSSTERARLDAAARKRRHTPYGYRRLRPSAAARVRSFSTMALPFPDGQAPARNRREPLIETS